MANERKPSGLITPRRVVIAVCFSLVVITWLVFGQTLTHDFVNYDDQAYVFENAPVTKGLTGSGIIWAFTQAHSFNWHPLTWISHMLDCQFFGLNAGGHHFTSVLLHAAGAVLLFLVLLQMTNGGNFRKDADHRPATHGATNSHLKAGSARLSSLSRRSPATADQLSTSLWPCAFVAAIFAIHPLHVESVAWVAERKDVLSAIFFFLTIGAYTYYVRSPSLFRYLLVFLLFALGLMAKPMLVTVPFVLLILDYWPLDRLARSPRNKSKRKQAGIGIQWNVVASLIREKIPLFALSLASCVITLIVQKHAIAPVNQLPLTPRLANAFVSGAIYLRQMFVPLRLSPLYLLTAKSPVSAEVLLSVAVLVLVTVAAIAFRKERPYLLAGWLWYWVMLLPVLGVVQVGWQAHADRYTYLPQIGLYLMLTWTVADLSHSWPYRREILAGLSGLVIVTFGSLAWKQASYWQDSESLWRHAITVTPDNHIAFTNLGDSLLKKNRTDDAIAQYQKALELVRTDSDAENGLGSALFREKQTDQAIDHYRKAIGFRPEDPEYHNNLGNALCERGLIDDGIANYEKALELRPDRADLSNAETEYNLANALLRKNQIDEAIVHFRRSLEIQPNDADTYDNLGNALQRRGMAAEAISQYQKALQIDPQHVRALGDFAWALATCSDATFRNGPKAVDLAERAKNLTGEADPVALRTLAAAYAEAGEFQRAIETARNAMQLANSQQNPRLTNILEREIALYQTNSPYHQTRR